MVGASYHGFDTYGNYLHQHPQANLVEARKIVAALFPENFIAGWCNHALLSIIPENGMELMRCEHFEGLMAQNQLSIILSSNTKNYYTLNN